MTTRAQVQSIIFVVVIKRTCNFQQCIVFSSHCHQQNMQLSATVLCHCECLPDCQSSASSRASHAVILADLIISLWYGDCRTIVSVHTWLHGARQVLSIQSRAWYEGNIPERLRLYFLTTMVTFNGSLLDPVKVPQNFSVRHKFTSSKADDMALGTWLEWFQFFHLDCSEVQKLELLWRMLCSHAVMHYVIMLLEEL